MNHPPQRTQPFRYRRETIRDDDVNEMDVLVALEEEENDEEENNHKQPQIIRRSPSDEDEPFDCPQVRGVSLPVPVEQQIYAPSANGWATDVHLTRQQHYQDMSDSPPMRKQPWKQPNRDNSQSLPPGPLSPENPPPPPKSSSHYHHRMPTSRVKSKASRPWRIDSNSWKQQMQERKAVFALSGVTLPEGGDDDGDKDDISVGDVVSLAELDELDESAISVAGSEDSVVGGSVDAVGSKEEHENSTALGDTDDSVYTADADDIVEDGSLDAEGSEKEQEHDQVEEEDGRVGLENEPETPPSQPTPQVEAYSETQREEELQFIFKKSLVLCDLRFRQSLTSLEQCVVAQGRAGVEQETTPSESTPQTEVPTTALVQKSLVLDEEVPTVLIQKGLVLDDLRSRQAQASFFSFDKGKQEQCVVTIAKGRADLVEQETMQGQRRPTPPTNDSATPQRILLTELQTRISSIYTGHHHELEAVSPKKNTIATTPATRDDTQEPVDLTCFVEPPELSSLMEPSSPEPEPDTPVHVMNNIVVLETPESIKSEPEVPIDETNKGDDDTSSNYDIVQVSDNHNSPERSQTKTNRESVKGNKWKDRLAKKKQHHGVQQKDLHDQDCLIETTTPNSENDQATVKKEPLEPIDLRTPEAHVEVMPGEASVQDSDTSTSLEKSKSKRETVKGIKWKERIAKIKSELELPIEEIPWLNENDDDKPGDARVQGNDSSTPLMSNTKRESVKGTKWKERVLAKKKHGAKQSDNNDEESRVQVARVDPRSEKEEPPAKVANGNARFSSVNLPLFYRETFEEDAFVKDDQSYMEYTVADDTPQRQPQQQFYGRRTDPSSDEALVDDQSYMEYTVADDTAQRQPLQQFYGRRTDSFEEETVVEDDQSYMEYTVADDTPQRQPQQHFDGRRTDTFEEETVVEDDQSYMEYTVADDTPQGQQQQPFYGRRTDSFDEETVVEDDQSYMEFTVADDIPVCFPVHGQQQHQKDKHNDRANHKQLQQEERREKKGPMETKAHTAFTATLLSSRMFSDLNFATQPAVPTITVDNDPDDDMTVLTFDESYMKFDTPFDKDDKATPEISGETLNESNGSDCSDSSAKRISEILRKDIYSLDSVVVQASLESISNKAALGPQNRHVIAECGGVLAIVMAIQSTQNDAHIQMAGFTALEKMALDPDTQMAIGDVGGISLIARTMREHVDDVGVQQAACAALVNISRHRGTTDEAVGAVQALCTAMTRHAGNMEIQASAFGALANLCIDNKNRLNELAKAGGLGVMTMALQKPWKSKSEKHEAISNLSILLRCLTEQEEPDEANETLDQSLHYCEPAYTPIRTKPGKSSVDKQRRDQVKGSGQSLDNRSRSTESTAEPTESTAEPESVVKEDCVLS